METNRDRGGRGVLHYDEAICYWVQFRTFEKFVQSIIYLLNIARKESGLLMTCDISLSGFTGW